MLNAVARVLIDFMLVIVALLCVFFASAVVVGVSKAILVCPRASTQITFQW